MFSIVAISIYIPTDYHNNFSEHSYRCKIKETEKNVFSLVMRTQNLLFWQFSYITYSNVNYVYRMARKVPGTDLPCSWGSVPFDCLSLYLTPVPTKPGFVFEVYLTYNDVSLVPVTQCSDLMFLYISKWSPRCLVVIVIYINI